MKAIKTLVIGMGVLIVAGIALVIYGVSHKVGPSATVAAPAAGPSYAVALPIPPGSRLEQMETMGDRIALRISNGDKDMVLIVDSHTGAVVGRLSFVPDGR